MPILKKNTMDLFTQIEMPERNQNGNNESYQANKEHFKSQTEIVLEHLMRGETVTGTRMYELHKIQDVRPRIAAIKKTLIGTNMRLVEERIKGGHGAKSWRIEK